MPQSSVVFCYKKKGSKLRSRSFSNIALISLLPINFQILLALFSALGGICALFLLLVPVGRVTIPFPDQMVMAMKCSNDTGFKTITLTNLSPVRNIHAMTFVRVGGSFGFTIAEGEECHAKMQSSDSDVNSIESTNNAPPLDYKNINITLESCGLLCDTTSPEKVSRAYPVPQYSCTCRTTHSPRISFSI